MLSGRRQVDAGHNLTWDNHVVASVLRFQTQQLAQRCFYAYLIIIGRMAPFIKGKNPDNRRVAPAGLYRRLLRHNLKSLGWSTADSDQLFRAAGNAGGTDGRNADAVWTRAQANADESERRYLILVVDATRTDVVLETS